MNQIIDNTTVEKRKYITGFICALGAISIWAGWMAITRLGVTTSLSVYDITMLRFGVAGTLLLPIVIKKGLGIKKLGILKFTVLICGAGVPYSLIASSGLVYAPAAHAGALIPGVMPLFVALLTAIFLKETFTKKRLLGYGLILSGLLVIIGLFHLGYKAEQLPGHTLMLLASLMWASYTVVLRTSQLDALHAAAIVAVSSMLLFSPFYFAMNGLSIMELPTEEVLLQAGFQGVIATILALYLFGKAITILGASLGASFGSLVPILAALFAIPILGELPSGLDWFAILIVTIGVYMASGASVSITR